MKVVISRMMGSDAWRKGSRQVGSDDVAVDRLDDRRMTAVNVTPSRTLTCADAAAFTGTQRSSARGMSGSHPVAAGQDSPEVDVAAMLRLLRFWNDAPKQVRTDLTVKE